MKVNVLLGEKVSKSLFFVTHSPLYIKSLWTRRKLLLSTRFLECM